MKAVKKALWASNKYLLPVTLPESCSVIFIRFSSSFSVKSPHAKKGRKKRNIFTLKNSVEKANSCSCGMEGQGREDVACRKKGVKANQEGELK